MVLLKYGLKKNGLLNRTFFSNFGLSRRGRPTQEV